MNQNQASQGMVTYRQGVPTPLDHNAVRDDGLVRIPRDDGLMPDRCIRCNAPAESYRMLQPLKRAFVGMQIPMETDTHSPILEIPLCPKHRKRNELIQNLRYVGYVLTVLSFLSAFVHLGLLVGGFLLTLLCFFASALLNFTVSPARETREFVWIPASRPFLSSLPSKEDLEKQA